MPNPIFKSWILQAQNDFKWAQDTFDRDYFAQTCFICQQVAEKTLKSYAYFNGAAFIKGHSLVKLCQELKINGDLLRAARQLDLYYISSRYPYGIPDNGPPYEYFGKEQAQEAIELANLYLQKIVPLLIMPKGEGQN